MQLYCSPIELGVANLMRGGRIKRVGPTYRKAIVLHRKLEESVATTEFGLNTEWLPVRRVEYIQGDVRVVHDIEINTIPRAVDNSSPEELEKVLETLEKVGDVRERFLIFKQTGLEWKRIVHHWFNPGGWVYYDDDKLANEAVLVQRLYRELRKLAKEGHPFPWGARTGTQGRPSDSTRAGG